MQARQDFEGFGDHLRVPFLKGERLRVQLTEESEAWKVEEMWLQHHASFADRDHRTSLRVVAAGRRGGAREEPPAPSTVGDFNGAVEQSMNPDAPVADECQRRSGHGKRQDCLVGSREAYVLMRHDPQPEDELRELAEV